MAEEESLSEDGSGAGLGGVQPTTLAYLTCPTDSGGGFLGALLICDERGRPLHFTWVAPVRPTVMQKILYAVTLSSFVKIDVITKRLFDKIPVRAEMVFVDAADLIRSREITGLPTAHLTKNPAAPSSATSLSTIQYDTNGNRADEERIGRVVAALEREVDLLEPFKRIGEALREALKDKTPS